MKRILSIGSMFVVGSLGLFSCVGSPIHSTLTYVGVQSDIKKNNAALVNLQLGMSQADVRTVLSDPERSEGYAWGSVWLYRTSMAKGISGGIYGSEDADFTPVVFDQDKILIGWGRNFYEQRVSKYELTIKQ